MELRDSPAAGLELPTTGAARREELPRLDNGDLLHSREFLRRYEAMPELKKAELVEGVVYMGSPVSIRHAEPDSLVQAWLGWYAARTLCVRAATNATLQFDSDNVFQPDAILRRLPEYGGRCRIAENHYLSGPPELVVEIAATSASVDLHAKLRVYRRHGVAEYLVWQVFEKRIDWFTLDEDDYLPLAPDASGVIESGKFPGLACRIAEFLRLDSAAVLATLESRLGAPAHATFASSLQTTPTKVA